MRTLKTVSIVAALASVTACASVPVKRSQVSILTPAIEATELPPVVQAFATPADAIAAFDQRTSGKIAFIPNTYRVSDISVTVPRTLVVSEFNRVVTRGDIVWREDPAGDRYRQIEAIVSDAFQVGTKDLNGPTPIVVHVMVDRFHALTEKARLTTGGVHTIGFRLMFKHAQTGVQIGEIKRLNVAFEAYGGLEAARAEARGFNQKARIKGQLAEAIYQELTHQGGYQRRSMGPVRLLNYL